jgi:hypothetical protein
MRRHDSDHYGGSIMPAHDAFAEKFRQLLREIPAGTALPEWQYLYRQVIFSMGMEILERFREDAVGPDPSAQGAPGGDPPPAKTNPIVTPASQTGGGHPSAPCGQVVGVASFALCITPTAPKKPTKPK